MVEGCSGAGVAQESHSKTGHYERCCMADFGDDTGCGCGIVVVRRKEAGAGWRAGFEAALRGRWGLADPNPTGWPAAHPFRSGVRVCVLLRALSNFWLQAKMDGVGQEYVRWVYLGRVR